MNTIKKTETAAQIVALMEAMFERPNAVEMESILEIAKWQIRDATKIKEMTLDQAQSSSGHQ